MCKSLLAALIIILAGCNFSSPPIIIDNEEVRVEQNQKGGGALTILSAENKYSDNLVEYQEEKFQSVLKSNPNTVLCAGFGGGMIERYFMLDLDNDNQNDMVYLYYWGSGVAGYGIKAFSDGVVLDGEIKWSNFDGTIENINGHLFIVSKVDNNTIKIGELKISVIESQKVLTIEYSKDLTEELKSVFGVLQ